MSAILIRVRRRLPILMVPLAAGVICACQSKREEPFTPPPPTPTARPPIIQNVSAVRAPELRVGDRVSIVLNGVEGQIPLQWRVENLPEGWKRTIADDGRFYMIEGWLPTGSSATDVDMRITAIDGLGVASEPLDVHFDVAARVMEVVPLIETTSRTDDDGRTTRAVVRFQGLADWYRADRSRVEIWVDTHGLHAGDTIAIVDQADGIEIEQVVQSATTSGVEDAGETFSLTESGHLAALRDGSIAVRFRSSDPDARFGSVRVSIY